MFGCTAFSHDPFFHSGEFLLGRLMMVKVTDGKKGFHVIEFSRLGRRLAKTDKEKNLPRKDLPDLKSI